MEVKSSVCPMDCPDGCLLTVEVEGDRVTKLDGAEHPVTAGFICRKVRGFPERMYGPHRLTTPLLRSASGELSQASWDDALDYAAGRIQETIDEFGGESVLPFNYGGSNGALTDGFVDDAFFAGIGASRLAKTICAVPATEAATGIYGKMPGVAFDDYVDADCIVIWGANPRATSIHLVPFLNEAARRGAFIAVVDPRQTLSSGITSLHLPVYPGTDLPLALAVVNRLHATGAIDEDFVSRHVVGAEMVLKAASDWTVERAATTCGVPADDIRLLADRYAGSSPAVIRVGWGMERNRNGTSAIAAVLSLPALAGKFGVKGGGYTLSNSGSVSIDRSGWGMPDWTTRVINMTRLGHALATEEDPPIRAVVSYNANPAVTVPNQKLVLEQLSRPDVFLAVHEQVMTDTARIADVVFPATTFLEHEEVRVAYGNYVVGTTKPVVAPHGSARPNSWLFRELGRRLGLADGLFGNDDRNGDLEMVEGSLRIQAGQMNELKDDVRQVTFEAGGPVQFGNVMPLTADGKVHLDSDRLGRTPYRFRELKSKYRLALITPASRRMISSTFGEVAESVMRVTINPVDAAAREIGNDARVRVFNDLGEVFCLARVTDSIRPGTVAIPKGVWRRASGNGFTSTALCPDDVQEENGAACFNDARVEVEPLPS